MKQVLNPWQRFKVKFLDREYVILGMMHRDKQMYVREVHQMGTELVVTHPDNKRMKDILLPGGKTKAGGSWWPTHPGRMMLLHDVEDENTPPTYATAQDTTTNFKFNAIPQRQVDWVKLVQAAQAEAGVTADIWHRPNTGEVYVDQKYDT